MAAASWRRDGQACRRLLVPKLFSKQQWHQMQICRACAQRALPPKQSCLEGASNFLLPQHAAVHDIAPKQCAFLIEALGSQDVGAFVQEILLRARSDGLAIKLPQDLVDALQRTREHTGAVQRPQNAFAKKLAFTNFLMSCASSIVRLLTSFSYIVSKGAKSTIHETHCLHVCRYCLAKQPPRLLLKISSCAANTSSHQSRMASWTSTNRFPSAATV